MQFLLKLIHTFVVRDYKHLAIEILQVKEFEK